MNAPLGIKNSCIGVRPPPIAKSLGGTFHYTETHTKSYASRAFEAKRGVIRVLPPAYEKVCEQVQYVLFTVPSRPNFFFDR